MPARKALRNAGLLLQAVRKGLRRGWAGRRFRFHCRTYCALLSWFPAPFPGVPKSSGSGGCRPPSVRLPPIEDRRLEDNLSRKERYHCYSLDAAQFEGAEYADNETPETKVEREMDTECIAQALDGLSEVQRRRILMLAGGMSVNEIARMEGVHHSVVSETISAARKRFKKFF